MLRASQVRRDMPVGLLVVRRTEKPHCREDGACARQYVGQSSLGSRLRTQHLASLRGCGTGHRLAELNTAQIRALDRQKTVILLPGGILEEHGPYLPSYTDGYTNERIAADLAAGIARRPGWAAVVFPPIPLGAGGANSFAVRYRFPARMRFALRPACNLHGSSDRVRRPGVSVAICYSCSRQSQPQPCA